MLAFQTVTSVLLLIFFQCEQVLFRVYRGVLIRHFEIWHDMFSLPSGESNNQHEGTVENPIQLPYVTAAQFEGLCFFYFDVCVSDYRFSPESTKHSIASTIGPLQRSLLSTFSVFSTSPVSIRILLPALIPFAGLTMTCT